MNNSSYSNHSFKIDESLPKVKQKEAFEDPNKGQTRTRRRERKECLITINDADSDRTNQNYVKAVNTEGVLIGSKENFSVGEEVLLIISYSNKAGVLKVNGEVSQINLQGIEIKFKKLSRVQEEILKYVITKIS